MSLDADWGIAQGDIISPLLSNVYAHPLDLHAMSLKMAYVRYADNFITLCRFREEAAEDLEAIRKFIEKCSSGGSRSRRPGKIGGRERVVLFPSVRLRGGGQAKG